MKHILRSIAGFYIKKRMLRMRISQTINETNGKERGRRKESTFKIPNFLELLRLNLLLIESDYAKGKMNFALIANGPSELLESGRAVKPKAYSEQKRSLYKNSMYFEVRFSTPFEDPLNYLGIEKKARIT